MPSKYDVYWQGRLEEIARILREAYENGRSSEIDVSDIRDYGERMSWYGVVNVYRDKILRTEMAHARSLGRIALENRLLRPYEEAGFRLVITKNLRLRAERLSLPPVPPSSVPFPQAPSPLVQPQVYTSIHEIIEPLPLYRYPLSKRDLPDNGLYFFYEEGESFHADDQARDRIARVGTHREQDRLPDRISIHFHGDKNSSVFRRHLGGAIIRRKNPSDPRLQQWLEQDTPTFANIEEKVSRELQEHFSFRCMKVEDRNERIELEERLIATLAKCSTYHPSHNWLGLFAISEKIRESGMWNEQHVDSERYIRPEDLSRLEELVYKSELHEPSIEHCLELLNLPQRRDILELLRAQGGHILDIEKGFLHVRKYIEEIVRTLARNHNINISMEKFFERTRRLEEERVLNAPVKDKLVFLWKMTSNYIHQSDQEITEKQQKKDLSECIRILKDIIFSLCEAKKMEIPQQRKALILIPCGKQKKIIQTQGGSQPLPNIQSMRNQLLQLIKQTPPLADKQENQRGILNPDAPLTSAVDLYEGDFYRITRNSLRDILASHYSSIHVLIVSAFYGLAKLDEPLEEYELQMGDILHNEMKIYKFWQSNGLWQILLNYIIRNNITHVWSLLPDSDTPQSPTPYHRVFYDLWRRLKNTKIQCFHVKVPFAGSGTRYKRAEWLREILNTNHDYLIGQPFPPTQLRGIPGYSFRYNPC